MLGLQHIFLHLDKESTTYDIDYITASSTPPQLFVQSTFNLQLFVYIHSTFWLQL